ncbi:hypothetical protein [Bacillus wiedmannii]|uniref:Uncharacterized protein n=1 Tax=Bacillus wiedmannii TaxID=1890302 RepID=A0A2A8BFC0_9BACI|nr:hypothetical protein [Bacillus wiedmannii]PEM44361.1 hypothetical protein CN611_28975 [Bacillus wiedmannii]PGA93892.1 hypothetical protein COL92_26155 [Bacillus wiedmannii]
MFKKKNIRAKLVNKQGEVIRELNGTEEDLEEIRKTGIEICLVEENSYEMVATDEQLELLARIEEEYLDAWEEDLNKRLEEREKEEARQKELKEKNKWSTKKKVIVFGLIAFVFFGFPMIDGYYEAKLVHEGTSLNAEITGRHVEKGFISEHGILIVKIDGKEYNVRVGRITFNDAQWFGGLRVIKTKDDKVKIDLRYEAEDLVTSYKEITK